MKTIYNFSFMLIIAGALLFVTSCTKILDQKPSDYPTEATFWKTGKDAQTGLAGCYSELRSQLLNGDGGMAYFTYGDFPSQVFASAYWAQDPFFGKYENYGSDLLSDWSQWYRTITSVNVLLEKVPEIPLSEFNANPAIAAVEKNKILGEAHFIRAYTFFYMARIWGEFPMVLKAISSSTDAVNDVPYSTNAEILDQCMIDLTEASKLLNWGYLQSSERAVRANKGSVFALMAHLNMWRARPSVADSKAESYVKMAEAACDSVIELGGYELVNTEEYTSIFKGKSMEGIFEIEFSVGNSEYFGNDGFTTRLLAKPILPKGPDEPIFKFSGEFLGLFDDPNDARRTAFFYNLGEYNCQCIKYASISYPSSDLTTWRSEDNLVIFRLADIMLLRAEALSRLNKYSDARFWLNKVRNRAVLEDFSGTDDGLAEAILQEMKRELFLEGHNLYDIVRTGAYAQNPYYGEQRYKEEGYYWPVNVNLFSRNKYTRQTPYWSSRLN